MIYLTSNSDKAREAKEFFEKKHGLPIEILDPDFEPVEIQASTCSEVVAYTVKDAAERLGKPVINLMLVSTLRRLAGCLVHIANFLTNKSARRNSWI